MKIDLDVICISASATIRDAILAIDRGRVQIAIVVDDDRRPIATATDGDIRRGLLAGLTLEDQATAVMRRNPVTVPKSAGRPAARRLMRERRLHHVPIVDTSGRLVDLAWIDEIVGLAPNDTHVVLMAGGLGTRLRPLTETLPKPMLPIGDRPLLEVIIRHLQLQGFGRFTISVNYLAEIIKSHFGDGSALGVEIDYIDELERMGTAGALSLMKEYPSSPFVVMNGDILTTLSFERMLQTHVEEGAVATMGAREFSMQVPYGVLKAEGSRLVGIEEKPNQNFYVNAGIYVLSPNIRDYMQPSESLDMPELFQRVMDAGDVARVQPIKEYWTDIGQMEDLARARAEFSTVFAE